jgi:hypothetical protein
VLQLAPSGFQQCHCLVAMYVSWLPAGVPVSEDAHLAPGPSVLLAAALRQASGRQSGAHPLCSLLYIHHTASVLQADRASECRTSAVAMLKARCRKLTDWP